MKKDKKGIPIFMLLIMCVMTLLILLIAGLTIKGQDLSFNSEEVQEVNKDWIFTDAKGLAAPVDLPTKVSVPPNTEYSITRELPAEFTEGMSLCIRTSLQSLRVRIDGEEIYCRGIPTSKYPNDSPVSMWNLVRLTEGMEGKQLTLTMSSPYEQNAGRLNTVLYGSRSAILFRLMEVYGGGFLTALCVLFVGVGLLIVYFFMKKLYGKKLLYLSLFVILISIWMLFESKMLQFFIGNQFLIGNGAYFALILFPIPFFMFAASSVRFKNEKPIRLLYNLFCIDFFACVGLHLTGVLDFFQSVRFTDALILFSAVVLGLSLVREAVVYRNKAAKQFGLWMLILLVFGSLEMINFFRHHYENTGFYIQIGLFVYIIMLGISCIKGMRTAVERSKEATYLERLAYQDLLTLGGNRTAYDLDIQEIFKKPSEANGVRLLLFDLNYLKQINDTYGHTVGDYALRNAFDCIQGSFGAFGTCYRIGGDEFACILRKCSEEAYRKAATQFASRVFAVGCDAKFSFHMALGDGVFDSKKYKDFKEFSHVVDQKMYQNKEILKRSYGWEVKKK